MGIGKRGRERKGRAGTTLASRAHQGTFQRTQVAAGEREGGGASREGCGEVIHRAAARIARGNAKWDGYPQASEIRMDGEAAASLG